MTGGSCTADLSWLALQMSLKLVERKKESMFDVVELVFFVRYRAANLQEEGPGGV